MDDIMKDIFNSYVYFFTRFVKKNFLLYKIYLLIIICVYYFPYIKVTGSVSVFLCRGSC